MRIGVDFGTTRIIVAAVDRGNYPIVSFEDEDGAIHDWFPSLIAAKGNARAYGWQAWSLQGDPEWTTVRSIKRALEDAGPDTPVRLGDHTAPMHVILAEMAAALRSALIEKSTLPGDRSEVVELMLGVPAHANSNQRFLTVEAFQRAGFSVLGLLNEPSAASIEYGHKNRLSSTSDRVLVYDLGGGTFDVSLVEIEGRTHTVMATEGVQNLGGDDFDDILCELALDASGATDAEREALTQGQLFRLHDECRVKKEAIHPNTRRISIDLSIVNPEWDSVLVPIDSFYERCRPLIQRTIDATEDLFARYAAEETLSAVYITGGGSELPLVARMLKEVFSRKVKRSAHTRSATAIGLAIQADEQAGYILREAFSRHFGVWREAEGGRVMVFDPLFPKGTSLPGPGEPELEITRDYHPAHNVGHFRYLECSQRTDEGQPSGDIAIWDEILFPFDSQLAKEPDLRLTPVLHDDSVAAAHIEEHYKCDAGGSITVEIRNQTASYKRTYKLGRWASSSRAAVVPGKKKRSARK